MNCVGLEKLRKRIYQPVLPKKNKREPNCESISAHWSSRAEAHSFWRLVVTRQLSFYQAKKDILMARKTLRWLREAWPLESRMMEVIYEQRVTTWKAFLYLCSHPKEAPAFQRAALMQTGKAA